VQVTGHHGEPDHLHTKYTRQKFQPIPHPLPSMFVVLPREFIYAAQKPTPHTAIHAVHDLNLTIRQHLTPIHSSHHTSPMGNSRLTIQIVRIKLSEVNLFRMAPNAVEMAPNAVHRFAKSKGISRLANTTG
jgi:hypothetical protein